jgi:hypothetical protein
MNYYYYQDAEVRAEIDELLQQNATIQSNLGTDSTEVELFEAKIKWAEILRQIRSLDPEFADVVQAQ